MKPAQLTGTAAANRDGRGRACHSEHLEVSQNQLRTEQMMDLEGTMLSERSETKKDK